MAGQVSYLLMWFAKEDQPTKQAIIGTCAIVGYEKWIVCSGADFGYDSKDLEERKPKKEGGKVKQIELDLSIKRTVDVTTPYWMHLWLKNLAPPVNAQQTQEQYRIEVHTFEGMMPYAGGESGPFEPKFTAQLPAGGGAATPIQVVSRYIFKKAHLTKWSINLDDQDRPTESLTFKCSGFALNFFERPGDDSTRNVNSDPAGWDFGKATGNREWSGR